jgi:hypothetical protein
LGHRYLSLFPNLAWNLDLVHALPDRIAPIL